MKRLHSLLIGLVLLLGSTLPAMGQTALTSTTLSSAVADSKTQTIVVASATGIAAPAAATSTMTAQTGIVLWVEGEEMKVTGVSGTTITVIRGFNHTRAAPHNSSVTVQIVPFNGAVGSINSTLSPYGRLGSCTASQEAYLPKIIDSISDPNYGGLQDCFNNQWQFDFSALPLYKFVVAPNAPRSVTTTPGTAGNASSITAQAGGVSTNSGGTGGAGAAASLIGGAGGADSTGAATGGAGGAATVTAGSGGGTITGGAGGASTLTGGAGGSGSTAAGTGGAATVTGGAAVTTAGTAGVGGASSLTGGVGSPDTGSGGTGGAGGVSSVVGGAGGVASTGAATGGAGGALALTGGAGGGTITGGAGGAIAVTGGAGANGSTAGGSGGNVSLRGGAVGTGGTGVAGLVRILDAADATKVATLDATGISTATTVNYKLPNNAGGIPIVYSCGDTGTGNQTCTPAAANALTKIYVGRSTLSSNAATITFAQGGFTSTTSFFCWGNDVTTRANPVQMVPASATTATITNTTGASDVIQWSCAGQ